MRFGLRSFVFVIFGALAAAACSGQAAPPGAESTGEDAEANASASSLEDGSSFLALEQSHRRHLRRIDASASDAAEPEDAAPDGSADAASDTGTTTTGQSLIWVWYDYANSLTDVFSNASSFTHVSPALYQINYAYTSGVAQWWNTTTDDFSGLTSTQIATKVHGSGMKVVPLVFGGAGNGGTDQGIQNIISDSPSGTQSAFITSMVSEAVTKGYDGYNLDWEVSNTTTTYAAYGAYLESFLAAFKKALHAYGMQLSFDLGTWFIKQTYCSGGTGVVDLTAIASNVDLAILEAYSSTLGTTSSSCPTTFADPALCTGDFFSQLNLMCVYLPTSVISIGFNANPSSGTNDIAGSAFSAVEAYGIKNIAVWPDWNTDGLGATYLFLDSKSISPSTATWYGLMSSFLSY
jgi:Glycosyl hydrolases family 18